MPTLRNLADLPRVDEADKKPSSSWGLREGVFTAGLLVAIILGVIAGWFQWQMPEPPKPFDTVARSEFFAENVDKITPVEAWSLWMFEFKPLANLGTKKVETRAEAITKIRINRYTYYRNVFGGAAGVVLLISLLVTSVVPKTSPS